MECGYSMWKERSKIVSSFSLVQGRVLMVDIDWAEEKFRLINTYANTEPKARKEMYNDMDAAFMTNRTIIWAGDMNVDLDKGKDCSQVKNLIKDYCLIDAYRKVNKSDPGYMWENTRGDKSRLDYMFLPESLKVKAACVRPVFYSDHTVLSVSCQSSAQKYGKSYWKYLTLGSFSKIV